MDMVEQGSAPDLEALKQHPERYPDLTVTEQFSIPYETVMEIQLAVMKRRFAELVDKVGVLRKLADTQKVTQIESFEQAATLLFPHSIYKSYPLSFFEKARFDQLTKWLQTLTSVDLSHVDAKGCESIDEWLDLMDSTTELRIKHSSGTTGKLSFVPRTLGETEATAKGWRRAFQGFRGEPNEHALDGFEDIQVLLIGYRKGALAYPRMMDAAVHWIFDGDESRVLASNPGRISADVLSLGGRMKAAEGKGELGRLQLSPALLARRDQFVKEVEGQPAQLMNFFTEVMEKFRGKRVVIVGYPWQVYEIAMEAKKNGITRFFDPSSLGLLGGGSKGRVLPDDWREVICDFMGWESYPLDGYGMSEMCLGTSRQCPEGNVHPAPNLVPYLLDPQTGAVLPRQGTQTGRYGWFDLTIQTHWGGLLSGDRVTMTWDQPCKCGRQGPIIHYGSIGRFSDDQGGDDKITCAGAAEAHDRALEFIAQAIG